MALITTAFGTPGAAAPMQTVGGLVCNTQGVCLPVFGSKTAVQVQNAMSPGFGQVVVAAPHVSPASVGEFPEHAGE